MRNWRNRSAAVVVGLALLTLPGSSWSKPNVEDPSTPAPNSPVNPSPLTVTVTDTTIQPVGGHYFADFTISINHTPTANHTATVYYSTEPSSTSDFTPVSGQYKFVHGGATSFNVNVHVFPTNHIPKTPVRFYLYLTKVVSATAVRERGTAKFTPAETHQK